jgi:glutathionylspermidine synthase
VSQIALADNGWSFLDARNENDVKPIEAIFKLYPWERFALGEFFKAVPTSQTKWTEPAWKLVMSSKGLLAKMYQMFPESPWLIPTRLASGGEVASLSNTAMRLPLQDHEHDNFVVKPCLSREGSGVHVFKGEQVIKAKDCEFNSAQHVIQDYVPSHKIEEGTIMAGVWVVGDVACGLGIRLDGEITGDLARFLPHFFV